MSKLKSLLGLFSGARSVGAVTAVVLASGLIFQSQFRTLRVFSAKKLRRDEGAAHITESSAAILLDSIVSLVENYYVDVDRVNGDHLVSGAMRSLAYAVPELRFEELESSYAVAYQGERIEFNRASDLGYDELLGRLKSLIAFCERVGLPGLVNVDGNLMLGSERDSTAMVLNALLSSLDAHSSLLSADAYQELRQGTEGFFGGLGVLVGIRDHVLTVLKPLPNSPAQKMGVRKFDKIISIDGYNTYGLTLDKLVPYMRGEPGSVANLVTLRQGARAPQQFSLTREVIEVDSVEAFEHHTAGTHVLRLVVENFSMRTSREILVNIHKFKRKYPMSGLVLDLRGNPGGLLDQAIKVSDLFLDHGIVVSTKGRREEVERATMSFGENDYPIVVLMNEDSASASEIVAGALQDNGRAVVVGQPSFGKGSVQTVFELPEQRALKLTIARYYTPAEKSIQNVGIMPDVWIQPVYESSENSNLFGPYRYRNEQFLPNHLSAVSATDGTKSAASIKGYYLSSQPAGTDGEVKQDPELDIALALVEKTRSTYGASLPPGARRSSHWLALSSPVIREKTNTMSQKAIDWMRLRHAVSWNQTVQPGSRSVPLALRVKSSATVLRGVAGESMVIPWKVSNLGTASAENVSVFVQSPVAGIETREVIVGAVGAGQSKEGQIKLQIPATMSPGRHYVNAGIAVDAQALSNAQGEFLVEIEEADVTKLAATAEFIDGSTSRVSRALENNEKAKVKVVVENPGETIAKDVRLSVANLSGSQIKLPDTEFNIGSVGPGARRELEISLEAGVALETTNVSLGLELRQSIQAGNTYKLFEVMTHTGLSASRSPQNLSH